jgi:hypothetical protein
MPINNLVGNIGKREWAACGLLVVAFVALFAFDFSVWWFLAAAALFVGYVSWNTSAFFMTRGDLGGRAVTALALPVFLAVLKAAVCLGIAWLIVWLARQVFRF